MDRTSVTAVDVDGDGDGTFDIVQEVTETGIDLDRDGGIDEVQTTETIYEREDET